MNSDRAYMSRMRKANVSGVIRDVDRWRRALCGYMNMRTGRVLIRARVDYQRVLDGFSVIACRKHKHLSIEALGLQSGISSERINQIDIEVAAVSQSELVRLAAVYGLRVAVITRRLKGVFDQFSGNDVRAIENLLRLQWNATRLGLIGHISLYERSGIRAEHSDGSDDAPNGRSGVRLLRH